MKWNMFFVNAEDTIFHELSFFAEKVILVA